MGDAFFRSLILRPPVILGRQLHPLSPWHLVVLMGLDNPVATGRESNRMDMLQAIYVCSLTSVDSPRLYYGNLANEIGQWVAGLHPEDEPNAFAAYHRYLSDYMAFPKFWHKETKQKSESGIPWPYKLACNAMKHYNLGPQAFDLGVNFLACLTSSVAEDNGVKLVTPTEEAAIEAAKQHG